jgi:hypothetical protein
VPAEAIQQFSDEHENQRTRLAILHEFLARQDPVADEQILAQASEIIGELRSHLADEEQHFFPAIDGTEPSGETEQHEAVGFLGVP